MKEIVRMSWLLGIFATTVFASCEKEEPLPAPIEIPTAPGVACGEAMTYVGNAICNGQTFDNQKGERFQVWGLDQLIIDHPLELGATVFLEVHPWQPEMICLAMPPFPIGEHTRVTCVNGLTIEELQEPGSKPW